MKIHLIIPVLFFATLYGCESHINKPAMQNEKTAKVETDTIGFKESYQEDDIIYNDYLREKLQPIRANFKRLNSLNDFSLVMKKELNGSTEGGEAVFYFLGSKVEKIIVKQFGETNKSLTEFYLLNGKLSFVLEKSEDNSNLEESVNTENRSYFENGKLIHSIFSEDCGSPFSEEYLLSEQKRLQDEFDKLMKLSAKK